MSVPAWMDLAFADQDPAVTWQRIANYALASAREVQAPEQLHNNLRPLDRALAEAAWPLWAAFPTSAPSTLDALTTWWQSREHAPTGRTVLILDGCSLREMHIVLGLCTEHGVTPLEVRATGAPIPTDTNHFAEGLGLAARKQLKFDKPPAGFVLMSATLATDVLEVPFADCLGMVPAERDLVIWHTWPDILFDTHRLNASALSHAISRGLHEQGFWDFLTRLRQGRQLVITSDHGYATTNLFAIEEQGEAKNFLARIFKAQRLAHADEPLQTSFIPPPAMTFGEWHVVLGQRHWRIGGGYPQVCHGGVSLLEAFSPFLILPEVV